MTMSQDSSSAVLGGAARHPFDEMWYLQGEAEALGPYQGHALRAMLESGSIRPDSLVAKVGASQWTAIGNIPAFAAYVPAAARAAVHYAGFWIRLLAFAIDMALMYALTFVVGLIVGFIGLAAGAGGGVGVQVAAGLIGLAIVLFYFIYFPSGSWQATPGKRILGLHIIREDGQPVTAGLALGRYLSYIVSSLPLYIGFFMIGWNSEKKGLHDMICGTRVVYGKL
jgi:uncharacterized RDD family membrane protein YckC